MSLQDGGSYFCSAENGLGHTEKQELVLDVQYGPQVVYLIKNVYKKDIFVRFMHFSFYHVKKSGKLSFLLVQKFS